MRLSRRWLEVTEASFSYDETGKADRLDRFMGVEDGQFSLSHGGFVDGFTEHGKTFQCPSSRKAPGDIVLPTVQPILEN